MADMRITSEGWDALTVKAERLQAERNRVTGALHTVRQYFENRRIEPEALGCLTRIDAALAAQPAAPDDRLYEIQLHVADLVTAALPFRDGFTYDPDHSDLDNEQPIHPHVKLGDWRRLNRVLTKYGGTS